ncbi:hypothetical protein [Kordiimonas sp.]
MLLFSFRFAAENGADNLQSTGAMADVLDIDFIWPRVAFVGMFILAGAVFGVGVFNMWIRFAVRGIDDVAFPSKREAVFAAIINFIKVVALWICALIIAVIMLVVLYLVSGLEQNQLIDDCISAVLVCVAGAIFADTLAKTALVRDVGGWPEASGAICRDALAALGREIYTDAAFTGVHESFLAERRISTIGHHIFGLVSGGIRLHAGVALACLHWRGPRRDSRET